MKRCIASLVCLIGLTGCRKPPGPAAKADREQKDLSVSHWTDKTELFMEYPSLVAGEKVRFAVHLTSLRTFKPLPAGEVKIDLTQQGGPQQIFATTGPSRPGIFGVDVQPARPGEYVMNVSLLSPGLADRHELGKVTVYSSRKDVPAENEQPKEEHIAFLKEQQWSLDFATELASERSMRESLRVPAEVRPRTGGEVAVIAPISGRLAASIPMPMIGASVAQGQPLASLIPPTPAPADLPTLELSIAEANTALDLARKQRERTEQLLMVGAIPARRLEEARAAEATSAARLKAAQERLAQYEATRRADGAPVSASLFLIRSPIAGVVSEVKGSSGAHVEEGDPLFRIVAVDRVYVAGHVPEAEAVRVRQLSGAEIELPGVERPVPAGRLVSISRLVDPQSRTLDVIYEVENSNRFLAIGQTLFLRLFLSGGAKGVAIPETAVIDDAGRPVVFVQMAGESFSRRPVKLGVRGSNYVQVVEGLRPGERVVTRGAYLIRLAALSTQIPAHGHVH